MNLETCYIEPKEYSFIRNKIAKELHEHLPELDTYKIGMMKHDLFNLIWKEVLNIKDDENSTVYFKSINLKCGKCGEKIEIEGKKHGSDLTILCSKCNEELLEIK